MTEANLDSVLAATRSVFGGEYHALASRYLDGMPLGPFDDQGVRKDDPNDTIRHQDRRELRALKVFAAWVNHFDTKMHNSLDMYVGEPGQGYVRHYLIDFASTLGAFGDKPVKRFGYEYGFDVFPILGRTADPGIHRRYAGSRWSDRRGLDEVGLFDVGRPSTRQAGKPDLPHSGMANLTRRDGYWAAKILSAFTDEDLRLIVDQGEYQNPAAADFLVDDPGRPARQDRPLLVRPGAAPGFLHPDDRGHRFPRPGRRAGICRRPNRSRYRYRLAAVGQLIAEPPARRLDRLAGNDRHAGAPVRRCRPAGPGHSPR